ncbi:CLUMA_CG009040, isoform A [Clunio marinus]|uniref:Amine oxidase n=1 Tax=Clunio marinus TaxID=568069 RepID=A0A1J1I5W9_9DIPT|nr:CLUMA_CG009040, isoform A [Clunio marinus]
MEKSQKILIIGAGASGISAAQKLLENNYQHVFILEASNRIGGRIHSIPFGSTGFKIDLGGQWVSGENDIYYMMKDSFKFGDSNLTTDRKYFLSSDNNELDQKKCRKLYDLLDEIFELEDELSKSEETFGQFFSRKYYERIKSSSFKGIDKELADKMLHQINTIWNAYFGSTNLDQVPAKYVSTLELSEGSEFITWRDKGFITFLDFLNNKLKKEKYIDIYDKVLFNKKVKNIDWSSNQATIKCEDGSEFLVDHVIVTISLGCLKKHHQTMFTPSLPKTKIHAIEDIQYGVAGKVFLEFEENFIKKHFPSRINQFAMLWSEAERNELRGTDKKWLLGIYSFMHVDGSDKIIEGFISGADILEFESKCDEDIIADIMWMLENFMKKSLERPKNIKRSFWSTDNNFYGVYSFGSQGNSVYDLAQPLLKENKSPILLFGGEAADEHDSGFVHGAMNSGFRVAQEIIDYYHK